MKENKKMKILVFNWRDLKHSWAGGGEIYVFELAKRWVKMGHQVTVFVGEDKDGKLSRHDSYNGIDIVRRGGRYTLYVWAMWYYLSRKLGNPDIVVDVINGIPFMTPIFSRKPKIAFIYHVHDKQFFYELPFPMSVVGFVIERYLFPLAYLSTEIVAISKTTKDELKKISFPAKNIHIIYCGILKSKNHIKHPKYSVPTLLYLGRIKAYKRVDMLVEVFEKLLEKRPNVHLVVAGWGTEAATVVNTIMKSKHRKKIKLVGPVSESEKIKLLSKSWLFANLSIGEGWGISVIEANLHGTPAIAFNVPGLSESIIHNKTGVLVNNEDELLKGMMKLLDNKSYRNKLGLEAKKWAEKFDWDRASSEAEKILCRKVKEKK